MVRDNHNNDSLDAEHWQAVEQATELLLEGEPHQALVCLRDVVKKNPRNPYAFYYIGTAMFELGRFDAAIDAYEAALRISPKYLAARVGLSHCLRIEGDLRQAIAQARIALQHETGDGDALFALGLALASSGDRRGAIDALQAFVQTGPELEIRLEAGAMLEKLMEIETENQDAERKMTDFDN